MKVAFAVLAVCCFLMDFLLTVGVAGPPWLVQAFFYGGLASFAATTLPL